MNTEKTHTRKPWLAALLSFLFPGLGQMYCGKLVRAFAIQVVYLLAMALLFPILLRNEIATFFILVDIVAAGIAIFAVVDAWLQARRCPTDYELTEVNRKWSYALFVVLMIVLFAGPAVVGAWFFTKNLEAFRMAGDSMSPAIQAGRLCHRSEKDILRRISGN